MDFKEAKEKGIIKVNKVESKFKTYTEQIYCELCDGLFDIEKYGEGECPDCGFKYEWTEGYVVKLDEDHKKTLLMNHRLIHSDGSFRRQP